MTTEAQAPAAAPAAASTSEAVAGSPPAAAPAPAGAPAVPWLEGADETLVGYAQNKGWKTPVDMLQSYQGLEKRLGAPAERLLTLPGEDATPEDWGKVFDRLGRPKDAAEYKIDVPEGIGDKEFADQARSWFHEAGLTAKQAEAISSKWNEHVAGVVGKQTEAQQAAFAEQDKALKAEWGEAYSERLGQARQAAQGLGWDAAKIDKVSGALGHGETMKLLQELGAKMGEGEFVSGGKTGFSGAMTPAQAKAEIQALRSDKEFTAKLLNKDADAQAKWTRLHQAAFPEPAK